MENAKFKRGDIIRISDVNDPHYKMNNIYRVDGIQKNGYMLWSYQKKRSVRQKDLIDFLKHHNHTNMREFIDKSYRLITEAEMILYGPKKLYKNGRKKV